MCGIAGLLQFGGKTLESIQIVKDMTSTLRHRGPDDSGVWTDSEGIVALGHRRLSILDLSAAGHQPMASASGRFVLAFNGEIYNHAQLRRDLDAGVGASWRGGSDTETLLAAIERWGLKEALGRSVGMFAIALWDNDARILSLARDRMGEKPLYYGRTPGALFFASELKAFRAFPDFPEALDLDALGLYFMLGYVPAPHSIYQCASKLLPGTILHIGRDGDETRDTYWSLDGALRRPRFTGDPEEASSELERLLREAIRLQSIADVPVGAFLSGGVDSSTVVALMQQNASAPVHTFSIGFDDARYNEANFAAEVARRLGTTHTEHMMTPADAAALLPRLPEIWDEPFADESQIPTAIVSAITRRDVTVSLSGDGGDELFCGYDRYFRAERIEQIPAKPLLRLLLESDRLSNAAARVLAASESGREVAQNRIAALRRSIAGDSPLERYLSRMTCWAEPSRLVPKLRRPQYRLRDVTGFSPPQGVEFLNQISAIDASTYLADDILAKLDRAAMATSLETRTPLLDHRIVEFAFSLPVSHKLHRGRPKWPLRNILYKYVPRALIERPKQGFGAPVKDWLRGPLRQWADDLLSPAALGRQGLLDPSVVAQCWREHKAGSDKWGSHLWTVLMFQAWREHNAK